MLKFDYIKDFPFAEKYLFHNRTLNPKYRKLLKRCSIDDIEFVNKIVEWKEQIESGLDTPFPFDNIDYKQENAKKSVLLPLWYIVGVGSVFSIVAIFIIIGFFIWGDLTIHEDYHYLIISTILLVMCFSVRFYIHIRVIKSVRLLEKLFPYAANILNLNSNLVASYLFSTYPDDIGYKAEYIKPNVSYLLRLDTCLSVFYSLIKQAIELYPEKILLYYQYGKLNSTVIRYRKHQIPYGILKWRTETYDYQYINIFEILCHIKNKNNLLFLLEIISKSKIENIIVTKLRDDLIRDFNRNKKYLLAEGHLSQFSGFTEKEIFKRHSPSYKFRKDKSFWSYACCLLILLPICLSFYPTYFRYYYVRDKIAEYRYNELYQNYQANYNRLYELEAVTLNVSVRNKLIYNNHVGHSWGATNTINGIPIVGEKSVSYHYGDQISIYTEIVEYDSWSDVSSRNDVINCSKEELIDGVEISIESYVYENRGRYSGCHAKWVSTYCIEVDKPNRPIYENIDVPVEDVLANFFFLDIH